jgi:opacity protein-like surface antigen
MRKNIARGLLAMCLSAAAFTAKAQPAIPREYIEYPGFSVGLNFGMADLWGDVGTQSLMDHYFNGKYWDKPTFMGGIFGRYVSHPSIAWRANLNYGVLYATDQWNEKKAKKAKTVEEDAYQRYLRNQDVKTNIWEGSITMEVFPLRFNSENKSAANRLQPYALVGIGLFHANPWTSYIDRYSLRRKWIEVNDLRLEGEGVTYSEAVPSFARKTKKFQIAFPVGLGLRYDINRELAVGVEYQYRFTMTDRLDLVSSEYPTEDFYRRNLSPEDAELANALADKMYEIDPSVERKPWATRGNKEVRDSYSTFSVMLIYRLNKNKVPWWY